MEVLVAHWSKIGLKTSKILFCMAVEPDPMSASVLGALLYHSLTKYRNIGRPVKRSWAQFCECRLTKGARLQCLPTTQPAPESGRQTYGPPWYNIQNACANTQLVGRIPIVTYWIFQPGSVCQYPSYQLSSGTGILYLIQCLTIAIVFELMYL